MLYARGKPPKEEIMDFDLTEELKALQQTVRDFCRKEIAPVVVADEKAHRFQRDIINKMGELGFFGCPIPEKYGGNGMGYLAHALACEEIAKVSGSIRAGFNMQTMLTARTLLKFASEKQKETLIPKILRAELLGCFCITEPNAGSDAGALKSTAVKKGDRYLLNGSKTWITWATVADIGVVFAYTDPSQRYKGMSAFIVDMHSPGITTKLIEEKLGWHACPTGEVFMEDVAVPQENLLVREGFGFPIMMMDLDGSRLTAAAGALGVCQAFVDESVKYANQREQFGQQIGQFQMIQEQIARMVVETEAARLMVYRCAAQKDQGKEQNTLETCMAKYYACDAASRLADLALLIFGAYGYSGEYPIERYLRDAKLYQLLEGSANVQKMIIAQDALGYRKANR
jgi:glutaryl-CoA dehydrogenase (non-decarboxylating)